MFNRNKSVSNGKYEIEEKYGCDLIEDEIKRVEGKEYPEVKERIKILRLQLIRA